MYVVGVGVGVGMGVAWRAWREREGERDRERAVAPSTAPRDGAVKTRALRRGGGGGSGGRGGGDGGSGTSSPLRSKTCLPVSSSRCCGCLRRCLSSCLSSCRCRSRFEVGQNGWELPASDSAPKWASVSVLWHSRISFYSKVA